MTNIAYFDNAATTFPKPACVNTAVKELLQSPIGSYGRSSSSKNSAQLMKETRNNLLKILGVSSSMTTVFTPSATIALNTILKGISWQKNDVVYYSCFEHNSVLRPLYYLANKFGIILKQFSPSKDNWQFNLAKLSQDIHKDQPKLVIATHASNVFGLLLPIPEICEIAKKEANALTLVDCSQTAGLVSLNLNEELLDFCVFAGHKTLYGTFGIGGFITNSKVALTPLIHGGTGIESSSHDNPTQSPDRYEAGTPNMLGIAALHASTKWILEQGVAKIFSQEQLHRQKLLSVLEKYDFLHIFNEAPASVGIVSCYSNYLPCGDISQIFNDNGIVTRSGLQCAPLAHEFAGTTNGGTVRLSVGYFTTDEELEHLDSVLRLIEEEI